MIDYYAWLGAVACESLCTTGSVLNGEKSFRSKLQASAWWQAIVIVLRKLYSDDVSPHPSVTVSIRVLLSQCKSTVTASVYCQSHSVNIYCHIVGLPSERQSIVTVTADYHSDSTYCHIVSLLS